MLATGHVVKEHDLGVLFTLNLLAVGSVARLLGRVHVDHFSVALVAEKQALI